MTLGAMGLAGVGCSYSLSSPDVLPLRHRLKVSRVDTGAMGADTTWTGACMASMVDNETTSESTLMMQFP